MCAQEGTAGDFRPIHRDRCRPWSGQARPAGALGLHHEDFGSSLFSTAPRTGLSNPWSFRGALSTGRSSMISASLEVAPRSLNLRAETSTRVSKDAIAEL